MKKVENDETTKYYYSGSATLFTANADNWLLTENVLDLGGGIIASARFDDGLPGTDNPYAGKYFFYHYDMRGSTSAIIQPDGTLVKGYSYDEFGELEQSGASDFLNEVTFTGSVTDKSTGLQYMNARYYQPSTGRFISQDAYSGNPYDPWTQHLYAYTGNNPVNYIDPTGHSMESLEKEIAHLKVLWNISIGWCFSYGKLLEQYGEAEDYRMYMFAAKKWHEHNNRANELKEQIGIMEREYAQLLDLQNKLDKKKYDKINQHDYTGLSLFDHSTVAASGCGMIAAVITASALGSDIDAHDAYMYFNRQGNQILKTGAIRPSVISNYLLDQGYYSSVADPTNMAADSVFITYYAWKLTDSDGTMQKDWHYISLVTDPSGGITGYNPSNKYPYTSLKEFLDKEGVTYYSDPLVYKRY
ncbi:MAG: RHS repeat-associated core domain-containing protein [Christensenellales bacterium]